LRKKSWWVIIQCPRTLTICLCLKFCNTSKCCIMLWGKPFCFIFVKDQKFSHFPNPTCRLIDKTLVTKFNIVSYESNKQFISQFHHHLDVISFFFQKKFEKFRWTFISQWYKNQYQKQLKCKSMTIAPNKPATIKEEIKIQITIFDWSGL
jgi:hypothetical protein